LLRDPETDPGAFCVERRERHAHLYRLIVSSSQGDGTRTVTSITSAAIAGGAVHVPREENRYLPTEPPFGNRDLQSNICSACCLEIAGNFS
jgi:hypothetical protein